MGTADKNGQWLSGNIITGTYLVEVSATRHKSVKRRVVVGPDETVRTDLYLPYKAVLTNFILGANAETGEYELSSDIDIDYSAPQAIVIPTLPESGDLGCNDTVFSMRIYQCRLTCCSKHGYHIATSAWSGIEADSALALSALSLGIMGRRIYL